ncbi:MAG: GGDEF domain-containing protein [Fibrobacteraceae bacterium]|nr:GGDEF domain-containing protein [Fibrobacteraceae bacterium]
MDSSLFTFLYGLCITLLVIIYLKGYRSGNRKMENIAFQNVVSTTIVVMLLDIVLELFVDGKPDPGLIHWNYGLTENNLVLAALAAYLWLEYVDCFLSDGKKIGRVVYYLQMVPIAVCIFMVLFTPLTHWIFYINEKNVCVKGPLYPYFAWATVFFVVLPAIKVVARLHSHKECPFFKRREMYSKLIFGLFPILGGFVTLLEPRLPSFWPSFTMALFYIYLDNISTHSSVDSLTRLNNRRVFDQYLESLGQGDVKNAFLMMIDVNFFKQINDHFGHLEGDKALVHVAQILKNQGDNHGLFIARIGGDEFALVKKGANEEEAQKIEKSIRQRVDEFNGTGSADYQLSLSIGYAFFKGSIKGLFKESDDALYKNKMEMHRAIKSSS